MVMRSDNAHATMDTVSTPQRITSSRLTFSLRPSESRHLQHSRGSIPPLDWKLEQRASNSEPSMRSPTTSCCSHDSFAESEATMSTAPSSPPRSPKKQETTESQLYSIPLRPSLPRVGSGSWSTLERVQLPPMMRRASAEGTLPSLSSVLATPRTSPAPLQNIQDGLNALNFKSSPRPPPANGYSLAQQQVYPQDSARYDQRSYQPTQMPQLDPGRVSSSRGFRAARIVHGHQYVPGPFDKMHLSPPNQARRSSYDQQFGSPLRSPDPLHHVTDGRVRKRSKDQGHNNKRYTVEQMHYIRYHKHELSLSWAIIEAMFADEWPNEDKKRPTQGVQGVYYRQNDTIPELDTTTNIIVYLPNGHMKPTKIGCREQNKKDKQKFGFINLFPEEALTYGWVRHEHKKQAAELATQRREEREAALKLAIKNGLWTDTVEEKSCACCVYSKREK